MSGTQVSSFGDPNILLRTLSGAQTADVLAQQIQNQFAPQRNQLLLDEGAQRLGANEIEMVSRLSQAMLSRFTDANGVVDEAGLRAAYPGAVSELQRYGFGKTAPTEFPGVDRIKQVALLGTSSEKLGERAANIAGNRPFNLSGQPGTTGTATGGGTAPAPIRPFVATNLPAGVSTAEDQMVRTVWGEAANQPLSGQHAVAYTVKNRMASSGQSAQDVIFAANQYEPWNTGRRAQLEALDPNSPQYQTILNQVVRPVMAGTVADPTSGATHFYAPALMAQRGQEAGPAWAAGQQPVVEIGGHRFYKLPYGGGSQVAAAPSGGGVVARNPGAVQVAGPPGVVPPGTATAPPGADLVGPRPLPPTGTGQPVRTPADIANTPLVAQNALAPPPPPTPAAQPAPAATAAPQPPRLESLLPNGLTARQQALLESQGRSGLLTPQKRFEMETTLAAQNAAAQEKALADYRADIDQRLKFAQEQRAQATSQREAEAAQRDVERLRIAQQKAEDDHAEAMRKAAEAQQHVQGTGVGPTQANDLIRGARDDEFRKTPEYHQAWAAKAEPKLSGEGVWVYPNMNAYKLPLDEDGVPVTTYDTPRFAIGPGNLGKLRDMQTQAGTLIAALDDFATTAKNASLLERGATAMGRSTDLGSAWTNAGLMAKGEALYNLGVLSGPDMTVIRGALADPSTFWGATASNATIDKQVARIKRLLETRLDQARQSYLGTTFGAPGTQQPAQPTRPPLSGFDK